MKNLLKSLLITFLLLTLFGCKSVNSKKVGCLKVEDFQLLIGENTALCYVPIGIGSPIIYEYSVFQVKDTLSLSIKNKNNKHLILPYISKNEINGNTLTLSFVDIYSLLSYDNPYSLSEIYLNDKKFTTQESGKFLIKKSEIPYNKGNVKVHFYDLGIFETIISINNDKYSFFCHRNTQMPLKSFEKIKIINKNVIISSERNFIKSKIRIKKENECLLYELLNQYI